MSIFKKKERFIFKKVEERFVIPQLDESTEGLLKNKRGFESSKIGSVFFGTQIPDKIHVIDNKGTIDVDKAYDNFRIDEEKHISDEELISKHGSKFYEFQQITNKTRKEVLGTSYEDNKIKEPLCSNNAERKNDFSFVESKDDFIGINETIKQDNNSVQECTLKDDNPEIILNLDPDDGQSFEYGSFDTKLKEINTTPNLPEFLTGKPDIISNNEKINEDIKISEETVVDKNKIPDLQTVNDIIEKNDSEETDDLDDMEEYDEEIDYKLPPLDLFSHDEKNGEEYPAWLEEKKDIINQTLMDFDVSGEVVNYTKGPTFTRYEIMLSSGVKVNKVTALYENFQMALGAKSIRIQAPIPGKKTVGIEVPNDKAEMVHFGDIVNDEYVTNGKNLQVALGKNIDGESVYKKIDDMPHCLVAGQTQSGKSVCMNTILVSLLLKNKPDELKLILVDPKEVELTLYEGIPHLVTPVITDSKLASEALKWTCEEMDRRYGFLKDQRVKNIKDYNEKAKNPIYHLKKMPYIVVVIDELCDLMMTCSSDVEDSIKRITQKARAAGIHLIVATQRPTVDVINGNIKANIPSRIAFKVAAYIDSNTILDEGGAENLLGRGDMLIKESEAPERLQGAFISDKEINSVCEFIRDQQQPKYLFTHEDLEKKIEQQSSAVSYSSQSQSASESDSLLYEISCFCIEQNSCSINSILQQFNLGFNRAQRIVSLLEERGIVSEKKGGTKAREILVDIDQLNQIFERDEK